MAHSGYMSPEYAVDGNFSVKSDVFSFGVLVLEIMSGRRNRGFWHPEHDLNLLGHVSIRWVAPPANYFKVNFDASWSKDDCIVGIGVVVRDHMGEFFAGMTKVGEKASSAEVAELVAAREAIVFAVEAGFSNLVLEGDNLVVMNSLQSSKDDLASGGTIVADIINLRALCPSIEFTFVKREGNSVAHEFAKFARSISDFVVWLEDPPIWVEGLLYSDASFIP